MKKITLLTIILIIIVLITVGCSNTTKESPLETNTDAETPNTMPPSIMVDGELYFSTGEEMPIEPGESAIKTVTSVIKGTELPSKDGEINFPVLDAKYAKINDYEEYVVIIMDLEWVRFEKRQDYDTEQVKELWDLRPMIKVGDMLFLDTGKEVSIEIGDSEIAGEVVSSVAQHEKPTENGQTNFDSIGSKYAYYEENIVVFLNNKWILFEREYNALNRETGSNPASEQSTENVLNQLANKGFSIEGENLCNADDDTIVEFGKAFVNLFNGAVAEMVVDASLGKHLSFWRRI